MTLEETALFHGISASDAREMSERIGFVSRSFYREETIIREGDEVDSVGVLISGEARAQKTDINGRVFINSVVRPGGYLGVMLAACKHSKSPVTVIASTDATACFFSADAIIDLGGISPHYHCLLRNFLDGVAEKALELHRHNDCLSRTTVREKVLTFLSNESAGKKRFEIRFDRASMAEYLCVDRSALSRELSRMKRDGLIDFRKNEFVLLPQSNAASLSKL